MRADLARPIDGDRLMAAWRPWPRDATALGIVCGSGFEDRADLLGNIGTRWPLLGNAPDTIARVKDPLDFATTCQVAKIPHPETSLVPPVDLTGWLIKRIGGAGGGTSHPPTRRKRARTSIFSAGSKASRFPRCYWAMAAAHWCLGSAHSGRRQRRAIPSGMAEPFGPRRSAPMSGRP